MFADFNWKTWFSLLQGKRPAKNRAATSFRPQLEQLEDRWTPSGTPTLDLSAHGAIGSVNDAIFRQFDAQPTGTGVINSFVRIQSNKSAVQQGYNSDHRKVEFDENTSPQFTRSLTLDGVPVVDIGGVKYREFLLDINQKASQPLLSLDELRIYLGNAGNLTGYDATTHQLAGLNAVYDLDAGADNWILLDARLNQGSGKGDMLAYIPDSAFTGGSYVYLYSKFGVNDTPNAGFEEWAAGKSSLTADAGAISGYVFNDTTFAPIANQLVYIDANRNGFLDTDETFTFTDVNGAYRFEFLATGLGSYSTYEIRVQPSAGTVSGETVGGDPVAYPYDVSLQLDGQVVTDVDFYIHIGIKPPPSNV
ncbi:MAG: carboxypeptidase regulatory-like domain-containing protein [Planctomycetes bacterium]|nr:carboxypeptidase regulatory-like domain-containing protein [Planctomycetota bacterium]